MKLITALLFTILITACNNKEQKDFSHVNWDVKSFLSKKFNLNDSVNYSISFIKKEDFDEKLELRYKEAKHLIGKTKKQVWPSTIQITIDSILIPINLNTTKIIDFRGDTSRYSIQYFTKSLKDSTWTTYRYSKLYKQTNYKNNQQHGKEIDFYSNGNKKDEKNYNMGKQIDTTFSYWKNGQVAGMYIDDGEEGYSKSKCYNEAGNPCNCDDLAMEACE